MLFIPAADRIVLDVTTPRKAERPDADTMTGMLKRIVAENARDYVGTYIFAAACLIVVALTTAFTAWIMEDVINEAFAKQRAEVVWAICGSILAAFVLRGAAAYGQAVLLAKVGNNIVARYQRRLFDHLMELSVGFFNDMRSAQIAAQINQNVTGIRDVLNLVITSLARDLLTLVALIGVMLSKDPLLTLVVFAVAPPLLLALRYISKRLRSATRESVELNSHVQAAMQETVQGITIVKAFTMEGQLRGKMGTLIDGAENRANRITRLTERTSPLTETLAGIAIAGVLAYAAFRSIYGDQMPGAFFAFVTALLLAYEPAKRLARLQVNLERAIVNARMIYEILDLKPAQSDTANAKTLKVGGGSVSFDHVVFSYKKGETILNDVSFIAEAGKTTALVGPSGAGKSTIISLIPRFYDPDSGTIAIDGQNIAGVTKTSLRAAIAYVSQQPYLFEGTIRDNIRYGRPDASDAEIEEAARQAHAHDFILAQPQGYDTPVGENGITLSGGQRQRLSIARALARNAPILLLDEATSALDTESEALVQSALERAMEGRTVIVIAHRLSTISRADTIIVMHEGKIAEQGRHEDLARRADGIYARFHRMQAVGQDGEATLILDDESDDAAAIAGGRREKSAS